MLILMHLPSSKPVANRFGLIMKHVNIVNDIMILRFVKYVLGILVGIPMTVSGQESPPGGVSFPCSFQFFTVLPPCFPKKAITSFLILGEEQKRRPSTAWIRHSHWASKTQNRRGSGRFRRGQHAHQLHWSPICRGKGYGCGTSRRFQYRPFARCALLRYRRCPSTPVLSSFLCEK